MTGVFAAALAGWLCLFALVLAAAAASRRGAPRVPLPGAEPPAVIGLIARSPAMRLYQATLLDLSARGWFRLRRPGPAGGAGPAMCELAAEQPPGPLTPYERQALTHVAFRAGAHHDVPAPALADGFQNGEDTFLAGFRREVAADARGRDLTQPRLRARTRTLLRLAALAPAAAAADAFAPHHRVSLWYILLAYGAACAVVTAAGARDVPSRACRAALAAHRPGHKREAGRPGGDPHRVAAYAVALGRPGTATDIFDPPGPDQTWSSFGGRWRPVTIGSPEETSAIGTAAAVYGFFMFPVLSVTAVLGFGGVVHGPGGAGLACLRPGRCHRRCRPGQPSDRTLEPLPSFAEFDGQVIRQWTIEGDDDTPTRHCVAINAGSSARAWTFTVTAAQHRTLTPGTFVHVRVNPRRNRPLSIHPTEPPPVASRLASVIEPRQPDGT